MHIMHKVFSCEFQKIEGFLDDVTEHYVTSATLSMFDTELPTNLLSHVDHHCFEFKVEETQSYLSMITGNHFS